MEFIVESDVISKTKKGNAIEPNPNKSILKNFPKEMIFFFWKRSMHWTISFLRCVQRKHTHASKKMSTYEVNVLQIFWKKIVYRIFLILFKTTKSLSNNYKQRKQIQKLSALVKNDFRLQMHEEFKYYFEKCCCKTKYVMFFFFRFRTIK